MRSVELVFDEESDAGVRRAWDALIERGLPSAGRHAGATNAPHVTLAVLDGTDRAGAEDARLLSGLAGRLPLELALSGIILFGDGPRRVLACPVIVAADLLALQREVVARLGGAAGGVRCAGRRVRSTTGELTAQYRHFSLSPGLPTTARPPPASGAEGSQVPARPAARRSFRQRKRRRR